MSFKLSRSFKLTKLSSFFGFKPSANGYFQGRFRGSANLSASREEAAGALKWQFVQSVTERGPVRHRTVSSDGLDHVR